MNDKKLVEEIKVTLDLANEIGTIIADKTIAQGYGAIEMIKLSIIDQVDKKDRKDFIANGDKLGKRLFGDFMEK